MMVAMTLHNGNSDDGGDDYSDADNGVDDFGYGMTTIVMVVVINVTIRPPCPYIIYSFYSWIY